MAFGVPVIGARPKVHWKKVPLYKLCVGDQSDNISGIPGFGQATWDRIRDWAGLYQIVNTTDWTDSMAHSVGLAARSIKWIRENPEELAIMKQIIAPLPMTSDQLNKALVQGRDAPMERELILKEFLL